MARTARYGAGGVLAASMLLASVLTGGQVAAAASTTASASAKVSIHLSQASNLASGQIVTVKGHHFDKKAYVGILQCEPGAKTEAGCESVSYATTFDTTAKGTFSEPFQVFQDIVVGTTTIDCVKTPGCFVAAGLALDPAKQATGEKISFNPKAKALVPTMALSSSKNLTPNQDVTVTGRNYQPDSNVTVEECVAGASAATPAFEQCDFRQYFNTSATSNARGQITGTYRVSKDIERETNLGLVLVHCEKSPGCALTIFDGPHGVLSVPISFNPKAKALAPAEDLSASSGLADGQIVTVTVSGFAPNDSVTVQECVLGTLTCIDDELNATANSAGELSVQFPVWEVPSQKIDCNTDKCDISVVDESDYWYTASRAISFNPSATPVVPAMTVTPSTAVVDGSIVSVSVSHFPAGANLVLQECATYKGSLVCWEESALTADANGNADSGLQVSKSIAGSDKLTCSRTTPCEVVALNEGDIHDTVSEPISFS